MDNLKPNEFKTLDPVYLSVRRDILLHLGIADPKDPNNLKPILDNISAYVNDVRNPFIREITESEYCSVTLDKTCTDGILKIPALVEVKKRKVIASGTFAPVLYSATQGLLDGVQEFIGLDQYVDIYVTTKDSHNHYDLNYKIINNSNPNDPDFDGKGYDLIVYQPDVVDPNKGSYFFRVSAEVQIVKDSDHIPIP